MFDALDFVKYFTVTISTASLSSAIIIFVKDLLTKKMTNDEQTEIKTEIDRIIQQFSEAEINDILKLMRRNVAELKEYYTINKQQARNAFTSAIIVCFLGFIIFASGVVVSYFSNNNNTIIVYSTISGAIVEIISGLFFWLYSQSLKQINLFHESLRNSEKFLTAVHLAERVTDSNRDIIYAYIIQSIFKSEAPLELSKERILSK